MDLRYHLRVAEIHRGYGEDYAQRGDLESAFVTFAEVALVLEKLPMLREYHTLLNAAQRHTLSLVSTSPV